MKFILKFIKPYKWSVLGIVGLTLAGILFELFIPTLMANVVDIGIVNSDISYIIKTGGWMIVLSLMAICVTIGSIYLTSNVAVSFARDIRRELFVKVEGFSMEELNKIGTASLITRTTNDIKQVQDAISLILGMATRAPLMLMGGIILAVMMEPSLSIIFLVSLPILVLAIGLLIKKATPLFGLLQKKTDRLNLVIREGLTGIRVIRAFNQVNFEKKRFNIANEDFRDTGIKVNKTMALLFPLMSIIISFSNIAIIWFGAIQIDKGVMQVGNMMAFLQYALMIFMAFILLSIAFMMIPRAQASAKRISEILQMEAIIKDPTEPNVKNEQEGLIKFENVTYRYTGAEKPAILNISFEVRSGQTTAIIGSTGSGKTTLIQLIPRFYDPEEGRILIAGVDVKDMSQKQLREKIGYVPQKASLFTGTIAENIRFGKKEATEEEIYEALEIAQAIDFVQEKENGIQTMIHQAGSNLSGGQKQRLSIARALVRNPEIFIFDDSFSALDYKTDAKLRRMLKEKLNATVIIVGQRINSIMDADEIIVLDEGQMVGKGTHEYLSKTNQVYQEILISQQMEGEVS
ncbi:ABC transporter ATP-binding protein [Litchfieldia salsa]|uniref:ATP-binding cassette, subfamily B n=1 Tax=Litchfieldia salsa TaxID=930152 RepID=A0A1H0VMX2_9BACI|nr:ABC transporter ATP-binding protein [Litchfieldia salsa]SDP79684.1 ATP-binding cassette, subfamily B [Litchfieldia salsa]